jgi:ABC-type transport system substrate-binding protein
MRTISGFRAACLALGLAVLGAACSTPQRDSSANGVPGGTLRVLTTEADISLDTAGFPYPAIARAYARALYGHNLAGSPERATVPVPDIAAGPPQLSADQRTYTFRLRAGVRYAPRSTARSPPPTSSPPSSGSTTRQLRRPDRPTPTSSPGPGDTAPTRPAASRA